jgi:hypothetical protein
VLLLFVFLALLNPAKADFQTVFSYRVAQAFGGLRLAFGKFGFSPMRSLEYTDPQD